MSVVGKYELTIAASGGFSASITPVNLTRAFVSVMVDNPRKKILNVIMGKSNVSHRHVGYTMSFEKALLTEGLGDNPEKLSTLYEQHGIQLTQKADFCYLLRVYIDGVDHTRDEINNYVRHVVSYLNEGKLPPAGLMETLKAPLPTTGVTI